MFEDRGQKFPNDTDGKHTDSQHARPVLELGQVVATPGAVAALAQAGERGARYLFRHECGDWGELDDHDRAVNDQAFREGRRVLSCYTLSTGEKLWIITEWDRATTTLLLPSEY